MVVILLPRGLQQRMETFLANMIGERRVLLTSSWQRLELLLNTVQCTGQLPTTKIYITPDVNSDKVEKLQSRGSRASAGTAEMTKMTGWLGLLFFLYCLSSNRMIAWACSHGDRRFPSSKRWQTPVGKYFLILCLCQVFYCPVGQSEFYGQTQIQGVGIQTLLFEGSSYKPL